MIEKITISQPKLSYHLKKISEAGCAESKIEGTWIKYYINKEVLADLINFVNIIKDSKVQHSILKEII